MLFQLDYLHFSKLLKLHHTERRISSIQWENKHRVAGFRDDFEYCAVGLRHFILDF